MIDTLYEKFTYKLEIGLLILQRKEADEKELLKCASVITQ